MANRSFVILLCAALRYMHCCNVYYTTTSLLAKQGLHSSVATATENTKAIISVYDAIAFITAILLNHTIVIIGEIERTRDNKP